MIQNQTPANVLQDMMTGLQQPIFWFDGDFRTWPQVLQRAELNQAILLQINRQPIISEVK